MRRQFRGRSDAFVRSNDGEQGFWPSYADMMAAVALILFFVMLLSYIQNLITGNKLENTQAALADAEAQLEETKLELESTIAELESTVAELESTAAELENTKIELQNTKTELQSTQTQLDSIRTQLATTQAELNEKREQLSETNEALAQKQTELENQNQLLSSQSEQIDAQNAELEEMRRQMKALAVLRYEILEEVYNSMSKNMGDASKVSIGESGNLILNESILFESGEYTIKDEAKPALDQLIDVFYEFLSDENNRQYVESIIISGHTDSVPFKDGNQALSTSRANNVLEYLMTGQDGKLSVYARYFCAAGYGETRPVLDAYGNENMAASRRIELSILLKDDSIMDLVESLAGN